MKPPRWLEVEQSKDASGIYARVRVKWWAVPLVLAWALKENFRAWWLGVAAVAALLVGGLAGADSVPSPAPDAAKGRRGLVGAGPGEQVFSGRKVFDGGVEVQGPLVADAGAVLNGSGLLVTGAPSGLTAGAPSWLGSYNGSSASALWLNGAASPSGTNYTLLGYSGYTNISAPNGMLINFQHNGATGMSLDPNAPALFSGLGAGSADVAVKVGTSVADGTVTSGATLLQVSTGIGGTEVAAARFHKGISGGFLLDTGNSSGSLGVNNSTGTTIKWGTVALTLDSSQMSFSESGTFATTFRIATNGLQSAKGTDSSGTPGAATIDKPRGISAIAIGASTVTITNSLAATTSHIMITPLARDTTCKELAVTTRSAGSFVVSCTANATAAVVFAWEVGGLL